VNKILAIAILSLFMVTQSFAATVKSAKLDAAKKNILIDVTYVGGCGEHDFSLKLGICYETYPVQCSAELIEKTTDGCEALISETIVIPLEKYKLNESYFKGASLKITGDKDWQTDTLSQAILRLP
jgi:hypothetical protein